MNTRETTNHTEMVDNAIKNFWREMKKHDQVMEKFRKLLAMERTDEEKENDRKELMDSRKEFGKVCKELEKLGIKPVTLLKSREH